MIPVLRNTEYERSACQLLLIIDDKYGAVLFIILLAAVFRFLQSEQDAELVHAASLTQAAVSRCRPFAAVRMFER